MSNYKTLQHTEWDCKYHVVFIPKYRRKVLYGTIRQYIQNQEVEDQRQDQLKFS
jgi:putative transposase